MSGVSLYKVNMLRGILLALTAVVAQVNSQICGCGTPGHIQPPQIQQLNPLMSALSPGYPCNQPTSPVCPQPFTAQQPIISAAQPVCQSQPVIASTPVIATTLIDNSVSNALANAIQLLIVSNLLENIMKCDRIPPGVGSIIETIVSNDMTCNFEPVDLPNVCQYEPVAFPVSEVCQTFSPTVTNFVTPCQTFEPVHCFSDNSNQLVPAPVAAEVYFPSAIPAQLTCNFGYMPTNLPCVAVNVEALPMFDSIYGKNLFSNNFCY